MADYTSGPFFKEYLATIEAIVVSINDPNLIGIVADLDIIKNALSDVAGNTTVIEDTVTNGGAPIEVTVIP